MRARLEGDTITLITLDLNLGKENGLDLAREVRKDRNIPIIMLTGKGDAIDRVVGLEIGADDYLAKPFELRELVAGCGRSRDPHCSVSVLRNRYSCLYLAR